MATINEKISTLLGDQVPDFIQADYPNFVAFLKAYYEWMENSEEGKVLYQSKKLLEYSDIDRTSQDFIKYFKTKFLPYFPDDILADKTKLIKCAREFYQKKGSLESLKFLFRVLYGEDIEVLYPKENILIASDGKWVIPRAFRLTVANTPADFDPTTLVGRLVTGSESQATCVVESASRTVDSTTGEELYEIFVSNINRLFVSGEFISIQYVDSQGVTQTFSEKIIGSISSIKIDPNNRGLQYKVNDPIVFAGGLSNVDPQAAEAVGYVSRVSRGQINSVAISKGGYGYRLSPNTTIAVINDPTDTTGTGATATVSSLDDGSAVVLDIYVDAIANNENVALNAGNYNFDTAADINSTLTSAFETRTIAVAPIDGITLTSGGYSYTAAPTIRADAYYSTNYSGYVDSTPDITNANWVSRKQEITEIGAIAHVEVVSGGINYNSATDVIQIIGSDEGNGYGASFSFTTDAFGTITAVTVDSRGEGYQTTDLRIITSTGSSAVLKAYRFGEGLATTLSVDDIGKIEELALSSRGSGYVTLPTVSLKVQDIFLSYAIPPYPIEGDTVFQYDGLGGTAYTATVDSYNVALSRLRVYNYSGTVSLSANLEFASYNTGISSVTTYGNGFAKASVQFLNGLIEYDGYFLNTDGFLSSDKKLQDSTKYHNFSYIVMAERALSEYRKALMDIIHPVGMQLIGYYELKNQVNEGTSVTSDLSIVVA